MGAAEVTMLAVDRARLRAAAPPQGEPLYCAECNTPILRVLDGRVIIRVVHHSRVHTSSFTVDELRALLDAAERHAGRA